MSPKIKKIRKVGPDNLYASCLLQLANLYLIRTDKAELDLKEVNRLVLLVSKEVIADEYVQRIIRETISDTINGFDEEIPF